MDRQRIARWEMLLPLCLALTSGCGDTSPGSSDAASGSTPAAGGRITREPGRLPWSVLATNYRGQAPNISALDADQESRFGSPSIEVTAGGPFWLDSAESSELESAESAEVAAPADAPFPAASKTGPPADRGAAIIRQPEGIDFDAPTSEAVTGDPSPSAPSPGDEIAAELPALDSPDDVPAIDVPVAPADAELAVAPEDSSTEPRSSSASLPAAPGVPLAIPAPVVSIDSAQSEDASVDATSVQQPAAEVAIGQPLVAQHALPPAVQAVATAAPQEPIPWATAHARTSEMEAVAKSADELVKQGFRLAERGAVYSARLKFFAALSLISRSLDVEQRTQVYSHALVAGRTALIEAWDFHSDGLPRNIDMARIVAAHRTKLLSGVPLDSLSPIAAQQRYFSFAQEQLALATGGEPAASMALFGLGKTAAVVHGPASAGNLTVVGEQMACYQAALIADDRNFCAMHELGVLLASHGRLEAARDWFLNVLTITESAATWRNLSVVWDQLGDPRQALQAAQRADKLATTKFGEMTGSNLRWVDPQTFARTVPPSEGLMPPIVPATPTAAPGTPAKEAPSTAGSKKRMAFWPWKQETLR